MDGCERRNVESEQQLIQAWADGCSRIHCQGTVTLSPEFFSALPGQLATNITLTGTLFLDWTRDLEHLQAVRHAFNNGTVDQSTSVQLLPIRYNNWLKMSNLQLVGWPTSMGVFMEMLTALPPGPGMLLLENTTWAVLDCTYQTSLLSYLAFPASVRPFEFPRSAGARTDIDLLEWDAATSTITIPKLEPLPLREAQVTLNTWTSEHTVGLANFSISCRSSADYQHLQLQPEQPADPSRCLSRQVTTGQELIQARLDDCRHVLALPAHDSNGTLQGVPSLSQDWYQWDRNFSVHATLSGVVQLDVIRAPSVAPICHPIASDAVLELWHMDIVGSGAEMLALVQRSRSIGLGKLMMTHTRFIVTGCDSALMQVIESVVLTMQAVTVGELEDEVSELTASDIRFDREQGVVHLKHFAGHIRKQLGLAQLFGQEVLWNATNTSIMCRSEWDIKESVDRALAMADILPPSLQTDALGHDKGGGRNAAMEAPRDEASAGQGSAVPTVAITTGAAAALLIAMSVVWLAVFLLRRRGLCSKRGHQADEASAQGTGDAMRPAKRSLASSAPAVLLLQEERRQQLLAPSSCAQMLALQKHLGSLLPALSQCPSGSSRTGPVTSSATVSQQLGRSGSMSMLLPEVDDQEDDRRYTTAESRAAATSDVEEGLDGGLTGSPRPVDRSTAAKELHGQDLVLKVFPQRDNVDLQVDLQRDVKLGRVLGEGAYGVVYEGWWRPGTEEERHVAVKVLDMDAIGSDQEKQRFLRAFSRELDTLSRIDHPSIVQCYGGCVTNSCVCVLLEYLPAGNLAQYVHGHRATAPLSEFEVLAVALQVALALSHLHPVLLHGDVKPENCLLTEQGHVKLSDFGMSKYKWQTAVQPSGTLGTPQYSAPEVLQGGLVNEKCDVYALAVLMWECYTGKRPWKGVANSVQLYKLVVDEAKRPELPADSNAELASLIQRCWHASPAVRPSSAEVARKVDLMLATMSHPGVKHPLKTPAPDPSV